MKNVVSVALAVMDRLERNKAATGVRTINTMQLQKLVYYCQAYHLAWTGRQLFREEVEAWRHGPVVRELWNLHKREISLTPDELRARAERNREPIMQLDDDEQAVVDEICRAFGGMTGWQLRNRTHEEPPWRDHYDPEASYPNPVIPTAVMQSYYANH